MERRLHHPPKWASSGGCAERIPVPFALKGYGSNSWQATLREPALGGGAWWQWADVPWAEKRSEAHWRGGLRDYGQCTHEPRSGNRACARFASACLATPAGSLCAPSDRSGAQGTASGTSSASPTAAPATAKFRDAHGEPECQAAHPRSQLVRLSHAASSDPAWRAVAGRLRDGSRRLWRGGWRLNASFTACAEPHLQAPAAKAARSTASPAPRSSPEGPFSRLAQEACGTAALRKLGLVPARGLPFARLASTKALLELDGFGYQVQCPPVPSYPRVA